MSNETPRIKTLQECKDEVAIKRGYTSWESLYYLNENAHMMFMDEIAELYLKSNTPKVMERKFSLDDMYMLSAKVVNDVAKNIGNSDWRLSTTPKMIADEFIASLTPSKEGEGR